MDRLDYIWFKYLSKIGIHIIFLIFDKSIHIIALKMCKSHLDYKINCCLNLVQKSLVHIGENKGIEKIGKVWEKVKRRKKIAFRAFALQAN